MEAARVDDTLLEWVIHTSELVAHAIHLDEMNSVGAANMVVRREVIAVLSGHGRGREFAEHR